MKQREVTDNEDVTWTCVQAYSGMKDKLSEKATELAESNEGKVTVICTPAGGAQTVRLQLMEQWEEQVKDRELLEAILKTRG